MLCLIYTSGTTGPPKGVQLTHGSMMSEWRALNQVYPSKPRGRTISFLPTAHVADRWAQLYGSMVYGHTVHCCPNPREMVEYSVSVKPTVWGGVPRIWEKLKSVLEANVQAEQSAAMEIGLRRARAKQEGEVPAELEAEWRKADELVFSKVRAMLGLDEAEWFGVGAAPTPPEVILFFDAMGIEIAELWGLSETCAVATINPPGAVRIGTVGKPLPGVEIELADDGEIKVRGPIVMKGYRNKPEQNAEAFDDDGWFYTGDVGQIDADGYLKIVDRKKELIINAAGKNMSPANIEAELKTASPMIGQAAAIGDGRSYNTALIVHDTDYAPGWAKKQGIEDTSLEALAGDEKVRAAVQEGVDAANEHLARVEQIKKFTIVGGDWLPGGDELTPTMKLKRKPIADKYSDEIEAMYKK